MCGKFTQMMSWRELHHLSGLTCGTGDGAAPGGESDRLALDGQGPRDEVETVTPMRLGSVIVPGEGGQRAVKRMRWGFAHRNAQNPSRRPDHIHVRGETIDT